MARHTLSITAASEIPSKKWIRIQTEILHTFPLVTLASESILPHFAASNRPSAQLQRGLVNDWKLRSGKIAEGLGKPAKNRIHLWNQGRNEACRTTMPTSHTSTEISMLHSTSVQFLSRLNLICVDPSLSSELSPHLKNCTFASIYQVVCKEA